MAQVYRRFHNFDIMLCVEYQQLRPIATYRKCNDEQQKSTIEHYVFPTRKWSLIPVKKDARIDSMAAVAAYLLD